MGDTSDNIPGVAGVGEKRQLSYLTSFILLKVCIIILMKFLEKLKENLENSKADAFMSKDLATINCDSPIKVNLKDTIMGDLNDNKDKIELFQN